MACYEAALTVRTRDADPAGWAATQNNLGVAWKNIPTVDRGENLKKAVGCYEAALTARSRDADPAGWAATQNNLGVAYATMGSDDKSFGKAVEAARQALTVATYESDERVWAAVQETLGKGLSRFDAGHRARNLSEAVDAFDSAMKFFRKDRMPAEWAETNADLAQALSQLAEQPGEDRVGRLRRAIACGKAALTVFTAEAFPREHADTAKNLAIDRRAYEAAGGGEKAAFDDIKPAE